MNVLLSKVGGSILTRSKFTEMFVLNETNGQF